ncbi:MAG: Zn-dependent M16 (insulinase) family peptidase [Cellvibrionaceae bacterium]|jgi:Zn-dependent M16 (insulinase) family peptidase
MPTAHHPAFEYLRSQTLDALNITISEFKHRKTGAQHIHMQSDNDENVFLVAFRTVPQDSTGVAHVLEHTVLCGSQKYPVRDPFFMMIRRSLNTFMNAFTSSDWTAYPFASQNRKDFDNLLDVYLDAVFFSRLDPLDFSQEGHRLEFAETNNPESPLVYKGVVFNEMKGAMSSIDSQLWQTLNNYLYPTSTYHYNSGGDPRSITDLSYQGLKQFYQSHYHPSNAIFMTFGNIPAEEHQKKFEARALQQFDRLEETIAVTPEKRYLSPVRVEEAYAYQLEAHEDSDAAENKAHVVIGWLMGPSTDLKSNLEAHLLSSLLFDNSASPLQHLLETSDLGASPSPLCGIDSSQYEMLFVCGLADTKTQNTLAIEAAVLETLEKVVEEGLPKEQIEAAFHQLELHQREIGGDGYPYGLKLILNGLSPAVHRGDVLAFLDLENALLQLRQDIQSADYIPSLIKKLLLENQHRVTLTLRPDGNYQQRQIIDEAANLARIKQNLSEEEKQAIIEQAAALKERQQQQDDDSILPRVTLEDIPKSLKYPEGEHQAFGDYHLHSYAAGTNGISYQQLVTPLPALDEDLLALVPFYSLCQTEVGLGEKDYLAVQKWQSSVVGSIDNFFTLSNHPETSDKIFAYTTLSAKALNRHQGDMCELMRDTFERARFDESARLLDLATQTRIAREQSITANGHLYAMKAAAANCSSAAYLSHKLMGLDSIETIKTIEQAMKAGDHGHLKSQLECIHQSLYSADKTWLAICEDAHMNDLIQRMTENWPSQRLDSKTASIFSPERVVKSTVQQAWITNSQVHFCARAYPTVPMSHPDAAALSVLGGVLRNGFLHRAIREQGGAYGGGASQDNGSASFCFYSYRDPRLTETLNDFDRAVDWLFEQTVSAQSIEESILGIIGSLDKPGSPAGEAKREFHAALTARNQEKREKFRQAIISVSTSDLERVTSTYLRREKASTAVITGSHGLKESESLSLEIRRF